MQFYVSWVKLEWDLAQKGYVSLSLKAYLASKMNLKFWTVDLGLLDKSRIYGIGLFVLRKVKM